MQRVDRSVGEHDDTKNPTPIDRQFISGVISLRRDIHVMLYHAHTLLLFTSDTMIDTVIPGTIFGVLTALSGPSLDLPSQSQFVVLQRIPQIIMWLWLMALQFCLQNQRHTTSIQEDAINKPWRPLPAGRINATQTGHILIAAYLVTGCVSFHLNVLPMYVAWVLLSTMYNDTSIGDYSGIVRNIFCAAGFTCTFGGALIIAVGPHTPISYAAWRWTLLVTFGIIGTTIHISEFRDETGDRARGRRTMVIELGRKYALWTVVAAVAFWAVYAPLVFLGARWEAAILSVGLGALVVGTAMRAVGLKGQKLDRPMYKLWCLWVCSFGGLPLLATVFPVV